MTLISTPITPAWATSSGTDRVCGVLRGLYYFGSQTRISGVRVRLARSDSPTKAGGWRADGPARIHVEADLAELTPAAARKLAAALLNMADVAEAGGQ